MYQPPEKQSDFEVVRGEARVQINQEKQKVRVTFKDPSIVSNPIVLPLSNCQCTPMYEGMFMVTMSKDLEKLYSIRPINGVFKVTTFRFVKDANDVPVIKQHPKWDYQYFTVMLQIVDGNYKGLEIPYTLHYNFGEFVDLEGNHVVAYTKVGANSKHTPRLREYLTFAGAWEEGALAYKDNVLPDLETRILKARKTFNVIVKDGWIDSIFIQDE